MSDCIFCGGQLNDEKICAWCGFSQKPEETIPGTLSYGTIIRNYIIGNIISVDGESTSYMAFDVNTQKKVVIKEFFPVTLIAPRNNNEVVAQEDKKVLYKNLMLDFIDLYQNLKKIESPAMAKILEVFGENKTAYVAMENVVGTPLKQILVERGKPFTFKETRWMFQGLFELLSQMAKLNITHSGISDETVVVTSENTIMLTHFAIQDFRAKNEHIVYKLYDGFSAPEQYAPNKFQGGNSDIYSLGCLIYYCVTGRVLREGALELKDIHRVLPKYAIETIKFATKQNPKERLDKIEDFVLMLDDKGTIVKPIAQKTEPDNKKLIQYGVIGVAIVLVVLLAFSFLNSNMSSVDPESESEQSSEIVIDNVVPNFIGMDYAKLISNAEYQKNYVFVRKEDFSSEYEAGKICNQSPVKGEKIEAGGTVYLTVSVGPEAIYVPSGIIGISYNDACKRLDELGISYKREYVDQTREFVTDMVAGLSKPEGTQIKENDVLVLYVANDKPLTTPTPAPTPTPPSSSSSETVSSSSESQKQEENLTSSSISSTTQ